MGHRRCPFGHAMSPSRRCRFLRDPTPDTWDLRPVATGISVDPVVRMSHCLSRSQSDVCICVD